MTYVMDDASLLGTFAVATNIPMIIGLLVAPLIIRNLWVTMLISIVITVLMSRMDVEKANAKLMKTE